MGTFDLGNPAAPLVAAAAALGISAETLREVESIDDLKLNVPECSVSRASALTLKSLTELVEFYGAALSFRFLIGDLPVLELGPNLREEDLTRFRPAIDGQEFIELDFRLDKARLLGSALGANPYSHTHLFLFRDALQRALSVSLSELEHSALAKDMGSCKAVILVPEDEIALDGEFLSVVGGSALARWKDFMPAAMPNIARTVEMWGEARKLLRWTHFDLMTLTPLHLLTKGTALLSDPIAKAIYKYLVALSIVYTASQTEVTDQSAVATYRADSYAAKVVLGDSQSFDQALAISDKQNPWIGPNALAKLAEWAYLGERGPSDRLGVLQNVVAHALQGNDAKINYGELIRLAGALRQEAEFGWRAFVEGKLNIYFSRLRDLEGAVDSTVKSFDEQSQAIIKALSDSVLAMVGVIIGSFIGAMFKDTFNATVFRLGLFLYAAYVFLFPGCLGLVVARSRFNQVATNFETRKKEFAKRLFPEKIDQSVAGVVSNASRQFNILFGSAVVCYTLVIAFLIGAALYVPSVMPSAVTPTLASPAAAVVTPVSGTTVTSVPTGTPSTLSTNP